MLTYSIILINKTKIDISEEELFKVQAQIKDKNPCIIIGDYSFAYHQFATILPKAEADFQEKMELRIKGFWKCKKYGIIHKLGESCHCRVTGEINPKTIKDNELLKLENNHT